MGMTPAGKADINMTPLIDVLLVLLIIFMIIVPVRSTGLEARIPQPAGGAEGATPSTVVVRVREDRSLEINTQPVSWTELPDRLREIFVRRARGSVLFVSAAADVDFGDVARVIDTARGAGITQVGLMR